MKGERRLKLFYYLKEIYSIVERDSVTRIEKKID